MLNAIQYLADTARRDARDHFLTHCATLDFHGQDMLSIGQTVLFAACHVISPMKNSLKIQMNEGPQAYIDHMRDAQYHVRDMIAYLDKRLHLTHYIIENDEIVVRGMQAFENTVPRNHINHSIPLDHATMMAKHVKYAHNLKKEYDLPHTSIAKAMQEVAVICLALSGMPRRTFQASLTVQKRQLLKLYKSIKHCRDSAENMVKNHTPLNASNE